MRMRYFVWSTHGWNGTPRPVIIHDELTKTDKSYAVKVYPITADDCDEIQKQRDERSDFDVFAFLAKKYPSPGARE